MLFVRPGYVVYQPVPITYHDPSIYPTKIPLFTLFLHLLIHSDLTLTQMLLNECRNQVKKGSLIGWIDRDWNWMIHNITWSDLKHKSILLSGHILKGVKLLFIISRKDLVVYRLFNAEYL